MRLSKKGQTHFHDMAVLVLSHTILLWRMRTRDTVKDAMSKQEILKLVRHKFTITIID
jgi:hypothetical protein